MECSPWSPQRRTGSSVHGDSPGKNSGVGCHVLLQGVFPTQGSSPGLLHCRWILYCLIYQGTPRILMIRVEADNPGPGAQQVLWLWEMRWWWSWLLITALNYLLSLDFPSWYLVSLGWQKIDSVCSWGPLHPQFLCLVCPIPHYPKVPPIVQCSLSLQTKILTPTPASSQSS